ncbi:MAG: nicotinate phosphoribosyltransferase [Nanoarchaeota archaeon]
MIIKSILDSDLYKFTMQQAVIKKFPDAKVRYKFINRNANISGKSGEKFPSGFAEKLRREVKEMEKLSLSFSEKEWMKKACPFLDPTYLDFLEGYKYDSSEVGIIQNGGDLEISIEGYWYRTILWEVPLMALVSELYMSEQVVFMPRDDREKRNKFKFRTFEMKNMSVADFGTRRRASYDIQEEFVKDAVQYSMNGKFFVGTSNVYLAYKNNIKPIGTHAHEWFMFHGAKYGFKMANHLALENWVDVYRGDLGIALSDTFTTKAFFKVFDKKFAKLFDGVRHDSGDPIEFAIDVINHYKKLGINPLSKTIIFSDGLDVAKAEKISYFCKGKVGFSFGIGTNFTNDVGGIPLNIVIKMTEAKPYGDEWIPTIKLSDSPGKHLGDKKMIEMCKYSLNL